MTELDTCPSFLFEQLDSDSCMIETPIQVVYWNGNIELRQRDNGYVILNNDEIKPLFKAILKHYQEAQSSLHRNSGA